MPGRMPTPDPQRKTGIGPTNPEVMADQQASPPPQAESPVPEPPQNQPQSEQPQQTREQWRDSWMGMGRMSPQAADDWLKTHGARQVNAGSGVWQTPYGDTLDLQIGRKNALATNGTIQAGWTPIGGGQTDPSVGGGMMMNDGGGGIGPQQSAQDKFMQMFGQTDKRLKSQGYSPS